jgi:hypothetical protein
MKKRDIILIASVLLVAVVLLLVVELTKEKGARVEVKVNGQTVAEYSLTADGRYELNDGTNILVIENGSAYLSDANCPDKLCVHQGKISRTGEVITCLPNKLTVTVFGAEDSVDLIS